MPTSIAVAAIGATLGGTFAASVAAGAFVAGFSLSSFATSIVLSGLSMALAKKPQTAQGPSFANSGGSIVTLRQAIAYRQVIYGERRVPGAMTFMHLSSYVPNVSHENEKLHLVITFAGHACQSIEAIYFDDEEVPLDGSSHNGGGSATGRYAGYVYIEISLGDEGRSQPFPNLVSESDGRWTNTEHLQAGCTKIHVGLTWNPDLFPQGIPNITARIKGRKVYDPRSGATAYSNNPALCIADYLCDPVLGLGASFAEEIDSDQLEASANVCDEAVPLAAGGTEARYALNGAFTLAEQPVDVIENMTNVMAGRAVHIGETWHLFAGAYEAPTLTLDEDDLAGPIRLQALVSMAENANGVKGTFADSRDLFNVTDFPALASSTYLAEDNGERRWRDLKLDPFVTSVSLAQRLGKVELLRTRQPITFSAPFKLVAWRALAAGTVGITNARYGWTNKPFEVVRFGFTPGDGGELLVVLTLRETASNVYDWSASEEQALDAAPNTNLPDPFTVGVPGLPAIVESNYETRDGNALKTQIVVSWGESPDALAERYQLRYKLAADATYLERAPIPGTSETLFDIAAGVYDFGVRAINAYGVRSAWQTSRIEIVGLGDVPADPVIRGLQASGDGTSCILTLEPHPAVDVRVGGRWRVRFYEGDSPSASAWQASFSIGDAEGYPGAQTILTLPLKAGSYLVKAEDAIGLQSGFAYLVVKQSSIFAFSIDDTLIEETGFAGAKSGVVAVDGLLKLEGVGLVDAIPDWDAISSLDDYGGVVAAGTYTFADAFNFGAVSNVRITGRIEGQAVNVNDLIDDRTDPIDAWLDFDGDAAGDAVDVWLEYRETDDDPSGSPGWSEWKRLDTAAVAAWGVQVRARLISSDAAYNVHVNALRATAESVV